MNIRRIAPAAVGLTLLSVLAAGSGAGAAPAVQTGATQPSTVASASQHLADPNYRRGFRHGYRDGWDDARQDCLKGIYSAFHSGNSQYANGYADGHDRGYDAGFIEYCTRS